MPMNPRESNLLEYLLLFLVELIVDETNKYALSKGRLGYGIEFPN